MEFKLNIDCAGEAFTEGAMPEAARILRAAADRLDAGYAAGKVRDVNGNTVGSFEFRSSSPATETIPTRHKGERAQ